MSGSWRSSSQNNANNSKNANKRHRLPSQEEDDSTNLVRLCINKPASWNWELTTSKSSPSIAFPRIQLFDKQSGQLLVETNEADCQIRGRGSQRGTPEFGRRKQQQQPQKRANIPEIIDESRDEELLSTSGQKPEQQHQQLPLKVSHCRSRSWQNDEISDKGRANGTTRRSGSNPGSRKLAATSVNNGAGPGGVGGLDEVLNGIVDQYAREGVNCKLNYLSRNAGSRRSSCERKRPDNDAAAAASVHNYALGRSKSTTYVPVTKAASNSSCTPVQRKKKYRRAQSVNSLRFSNSILERIREYKRCTSSSSSSTSSPSSAPISRASSLSSLSDAAADEQKETLNHLSPRKIRMVHSATDIPAEHANRASEEDIYRPKYTLRTSKAGTLVVCEESFRHRKVRRRPRSLTRSNEGGGGGRDEKRDTPSECVVFSPERVKTVFEYIGRAGDAQSGSEGGGGAGGSVAGKNRYQREIDNIDQMLEKLKAQEEEVKDRKATSGKSCSTRRHRSLTDQSHHHQQRSSIDAKEGTESMEAANSGAEKRATIRFNSHHQRMREEGNSHENLSAIDGRLNNGLLMRGEEEEEEEKQKQTKMDNIRAKRISFGKTTFKTKSTENEEEQEHQRMDINDVDNRRHRRRWGEAAAAAAASPDRAPEVRMDVDRPKEEHQCSDKDKSWAKQPRKQVRRTRRSLSADYTPRLTDLVLSSSSCCSSASDSEGDNSVSGGKVNDGDNRKSNNGGGSRRGRSRTRRKRPKQQEQPQTHKLIVQGKPSQ